MASERRDPGKIKVPILASLLLHLALLAALAGLQWRKEAPVQPLPLVLEYLEPKEERKSLENPDRPENRGSREMRGQRSRPPSGSARMSTPRGAPSSGRAPRPDRPSAKATSAPAVPAAGSALPAGAPAASAPAAGDGAERSATVRPAPVRFETAPAPEKKGSSAPGAPGAAPGNVPASPQTARGSGVAGAGAGPGPSGGTGAVGSGRGAGPSAGLGEGGARHPGGSGGGSLQRGYQERLKNLIEAHKEYPLAARKSHREGSCGRRLLLARDGTLKKVDAVSSCGHPFLDAAATRAITGVGKFPPLPADFPGEEASFAITMTFTLSGEGR